MSGLTGPSKSSGETSSETHEFDLGAIFPVLSTYVLRSRYVDVAPGGTVRVHSHESCPSFYLVLEGELEVHRSDRAAPERLRANDTTKAVQGVAHWWRNPTKGPGRLHVTDLRPRMATPRNRTAATCRSIRHSRLERRPKRKTAGRPPVYRNTSFRVLKGPLSISMRSTF